MVLVEVMATVRLTVMRFMRRSTGIARVCHVLLGNAALVRILTGHGREGVLMASPWREVYTITGSSFTSHSTLA